MIILDFLYIWVLSLQTAQHFVHRWALMLPEAVSKDTVGSPPAPVFQLTLRRTHLVEDSFRQLASADHCAFKRELLVNKSALVRKSYIW